MRRIDPAELIQYRALSSHGNDLGVLLDTLDALGDLPTGCLLVGICIGETEPCAVPVDDALVAAVARVIIDSEVARQHGG